MKKYKNFLFLLIFLFTIHIFSLNISAVGITNIDLTSYATAGVVEHNCNNYLEKRYDANNHWDQCTFCNKKYNINSHTFQKSGSDSCVWNNPGQTWSCPTCGYYKTYKKAHVYTTNNDGTIKWFHTDSHNWDYNTCVICGTGNLNSTRCKDKNGNLLGCGHAGTCVLCGKVYTGAYNEHGNNTTGYCSSWCQERYFYVTSHTETRINDNSFHIKVVLTSTGNPRYTDEVFLSCQPVISDTFTYNNFSIKKTSANTFEINQDVTCTNPTERNNNYLRLRWQFTKDFKYNSENLDICTNVDYGLPTITNIRAAYSNNINGYATNVHLYVDATDNLNNNYNLCYVRVLDANTRQVITSWQAMKKNNNTSYSADISYIDEVGTTKNVIVQVKDKQTYKENITEKTFVISKLDSKPPTAQNVSCSNTWAKEKNITFSATDYGSKNVQIAFNDVNSFVLGNQSGNTYSRTYKFTGDVYSALKMAVYYKDDTSNTTTQYINMYYLDNTAPTFTIAETKNHINSSIKITASDYCNKIKTNGSGQTADGTGKYGFYYGYSTTNDSNKAIWSSLQTSNTYNLNLGYGTYYIFVKDYVGNISAPQKIVTNPYYTISFNANGGVNPPNAQNKYAQTNLTLSNTIPTYTGFVFTSWNTKKDGTGTTYMPGGIYSANNDVTLYAQWVDATYDITYIGNTNTSGTTAKETFKYNRFTRIKENGYEKTGYVFKEWNTKSDGSGISYVPGQAYNINSNLMLYAIWKPISYFVIYDGNGAVNTTIPEKIVNYDESFIAEKNRYEYSNFNFICWNTKPDGSGTTYMPGDTIKNLTTQQNETVVLYAIWEVKANRKYTLTVKPNKGIFENSSYDKYFYYIPDPSSTTSFSYTGRVQTYTVSSNGYYFLEAFGASGGADACPGGNGGYVKSFVYLEKGQTLYIAVGGAGWTLYGQDAMSVGDASPTYNGGGRAGQTGSNGNWSGVGGGATSIATALYGNGELENYISHRDDILVVAGGGGGGSASNRGLGGTVLYAGSGDNYYVANNASTELLRGDKNPNGQDAGSHDGGGGGGGFVGGICGWDSGAGRTSGGGASFVNSSRGCYSFILTPNARAGHGFVRISRFDTSGFKVLEDPTRIGYTFDSWKNYGAGTLRKDSTSNLNIVDFSNADTTVEAQWIPNTYYVIYKNYDGKGNDYTQTCTYDQVYNYLNNPSDLSDSIFLGWYAKENPTSLTDGVISGGTSFKNLTPAPFGKVYVYGKWSKTNLTEDAASKNPVFIKTDQIKIAGSNIYADPTRAKTYFIKNDTLFNFSFNGMIDSNINTSFIPMITNVDTFTLGKLETSINDNQYIFNKNLDIVPINTIKEMNFNNSYSAIRKNNSVPGTNKTLLSYKQSYTLSSDKDGKLLEIVPHSSSTLVRTKNGKNYTTTYNTKDSDDKNHSIFIECDSTKPTITNSSIYELGSSDYNPLISKKTDIEIKYVDFISNINPQSPKYGSGVDTKNIKLTITQEQDDDGKPSISKVYTDSSVQDFVTIKANDLYSGTVTLHIDPAKYSDMSGFINFKLEITDNVGNTATKEYRILVLDFDAKVLNTAPGSRQNTNKFAQGENGKIEIETNGFVEKVDIKFPTVLDNMASNERSSGTQSLWEVGKVLSDTYPRDKDGNVIAVLPEIQTKLWGTEHIGGMQWNNNTYEHCSLIHYFYAPLYSQNGKYQVLVTIYKTDPLYPDKTYTVQKTYDFYIGQNSDDPLDVIGPITEEFRDTISDN